MRLFSSADPNVLNPLQLLEPAISIPISLAISVASVTLSLLIAWKFLKSYRLSGFGYLLGIPVGFVLLALSFSFQHLSLVYQHSPFLNPAFFWMQIVMQSEGFALIAISYQFKNFDPAAESSYRTRRKEDRPFDIKHLMLVIIPPIMVSIPFIAPTALLAVNPYFNYARFAELSFCMMLFNLAVIGYICRNVIVSLVKSGNVRLIYVPLAFALFFIEQYSLVITYFDNSVVASVGGLVARLAALSMFVYIMYRVAVASRRLEIEAREKA